MHDKYELEDAANDLGGGATNTDIDRLYTYYETFKLPQRRQFVETMLSGKTLRELDKQRQVTVGMGDPKSPQAKGGRSGWARGQLKKTVIRILYLRHRLDEKLGKRVANQLLLQKFYKDSTAQDAGQRSIRQATATPLL
jgi:hypothetical protein